MTYEHTDAPDDIEITTLSLDEPNTVQPTKEIWLSQRLAWVPVNTALEQFSGESSGPRLNVTDVDLDL